MHADQMAQLENSKAVVYLTVVHPIFQSFTVILFLLKVSKGCHFQPFLSIVLAIPGPHYSQLYFKVKNNRN